jgi:hypothetical protein
MSDVPTNVDLQWIGGKLIEMQRDIARLNDDNMVLTAIVNRQDGTMISLLSEMRAIRSQLDRLRADVNRGLTELYQPPLSLTRHART